MDRLFKSLLSLFLVVTLIFNYSVSYAGYCDTFDIENPTPYDIMCPIVKAFNVFFLVSGIVLAAMIAYGAIKLSMSLGDPKGMMGAKMTWTYVAVGFGVVVGFFGILAIVMNLFGIPVFSGPDAIFANLQARWAAFLGAIYITQ